MPRTNQYNQENRDRAIACLSLTIGKSNSSPIGSSPNEIDLAALIEGTLDPIRRSQVISHIVNNPELYSRWLRLIDDLVYLGEIENQDNSLTASTAIKVRTKSLRESVKEFFSPKTIGIFGGGFAVATIALLVILALPLKQVIQISQNIDDAYIDWGPSLTAEWANTPDSAKPKPKYSSSRKFTFKAHEKSDIKKIIETGFKAGSKNILNYPYKSLRIDPTALANVSAAQSTGVAQDQYDLFFNTGRLTALASLQCVIDPQSQRLDSLYSIAQIIVVNLQKLSLPEINPLLKNFGSARDRAQDICDFSDKIISYLNN